MAYGIDVFTDENREGYLSMVREFLAVGASVSVPGKYFAEVFPLLRHLPTWAPGDGFKRWAAKTRMWQTGIRQLLYDRGKETVSLCLSAGKCAPLSTDITAVGQKLRVGF